MTGQSIYDIYKRPGIKIIESWERIRREINNCKGYDVIVRGGSYSYSVTYKYIDALNREHEVYITRDNRKDVIKWSHKDIKAVYALSYFNGYGILDIQYGIDDKAVSCYICGDQISDVKATKIHYTILGRAYILRNKYKLYLDEFLKI